MVMLVILDLGGISYNCFTDKRHLHKKNEGAGIYERNIFRGNL
jgi:hypothetical protein